MVYKKKDDWRTYHETRTRKDWACDNCKRMIPMRSIAYASRGRAVPICGDCYKQLKNQDNIEPSPDRVYKIKVRSVIGKACNVTVASRKFFVVLEKAVKSGSLINIDVEGEAMNVTPYFLNETFGKVMREHGCQAFKERLILRNISIDAATAIERYIRDYNKTFKN